MPKQQKSFEKIFPQELHFVNTSIKEYIPMSDGENIHCYHMINGQQKNKKTIFFAQGFGSGIYSWTDLWDAIITDEFNLIVLDPRDKNTNTLTKKSECSVHRTALDIAESLHHLKIVPDSVYFIGSSFGASYIAHCVSHKMVKPKACFFIGPAIKPRVPRFLLNLSYVIPPKYLDRIGKFLGRWWLRRKVADGFQKKVFFNRVNLVDVHRWKLCLEMSYWDASEDFQRMDCPTYIFSTSGDEYHKKEVTEEVHDAIPNSEVLEMPNYDFMHIKPGVFEFVKIIKGLMEELPTK